MIEILLVEDDRTLAGSVADYLSEFGFDVDFAFNGQACLDLAEKNRYDAILMDISIPGLDGFQVCKALRCRQDSTPILFMTACDALADKVAGYEAGGDDYLVKPFEPQELVCRLHAILRRGRLPTNEESQQYGEILIDMKLMRVYRQGVTIELQETSLRLLALLAESAPHPVSRNTLEKALWPDELPESNPLRTHIYNLRQAIDRPFQHNLIKTLHGAGYRLAIPD